jgi:hypothetical protein
MTFTYPLVPLSTTSQITLLCLFCSSLFTFDPFAVHTPWLSPLPTHHCHNHQPIDC